MSIRIVSRFLIKGSCSVQKRASMVTPTVLRKRLIHSLKCIHLIKIRTKLDNLNEVCYKISSLSITQWLFLFSFLEQVGVGLESKLQEWFHLPQDMASPRWAKKIWQLQIQPNRFQLQQWWSCKLQFNTILMLIYVCLRSTLQIGLQIRFNCIYLV